jgi:hypothetical protein
VQGFNWESWKSSCWYDVLAKTAKDLAAAGITDVWFPPSSHSVAPQGKATAQGSWYRIDLEMILQHLPVIMRRLVFRT